MGVPATDAFAEDGATATGWFDSKAPIARWMCRLVLRKLKIAVALQRRTVHFVMRM